jgi:hypothetical protein
MVWSEMKREGYGASFNILWRKADLIKKQARNQYGAKKIINEMIFYRFFKSAPIPIDFPIPEILYMEPASENPFYIMRFYSAYKPLYQVFPQMQLSEQEGILGRINTYLTNLHTSAEITITKEEYTQHLIAEIQTKLEIRLQQIKTITDSYSFIKSVNGVPLIPLPEILNRLKKISEEFVANKSEPFTLHPIHGDCQFNNILIDTHTNLLFIDPRGNYGSSVLYGIPEYDDAKIKFALTGYDLFDSTPIYSSDIDILDDSMTLTDLRLPFCDLDPTQFSTILTLSIWLGNAHCFLRTPQKAVFSYFYAMWLASSVLSRIPQN